ncbi:MAG: lycopene cyclase domain-containing protein [Chitinophagales bacterium]
MFTYLLLDLGTLLFPLLFSFEKKVQFYLKWKFVFPSILITAIYFLAWDYFFTRNGIWSFNPEYLVGIYVSGLPLEEILFFICVPYACLFIYAVLRDYIMLTVTSVSFNRYLIPLIVFLLVIGVVYRQLTYTSVTFISAALFLSFLIFLVRPNYLFIFFTMYAIHLFPFIIINGILTALPVVSYNAKFISGVHIGTIPVEDTIYSMLMLLMNVSIYEGFQHFAKRKLNS